MLLERFERLGRREPFWQCSTWFAAALADPPGFCPLQRVESRRGDFMNAH